MEFFDDSFLSEVVAALDGFPAVCRIEAGAGPDRVLVLLHDCLPGETAPWIVQIHRNLEFVHPLFGDRRPCIEIRAPLMRFRPGTAEYLDQVAAHAAPILDQHRFGFGSSINWDPDSGEVALYGQVLLLGESARERIERLRHAVRDAAGLLYLSAFRFWQLAWRREESPAVTDPGVQQVWRKMSGLLGAAPPIPGA